MRIIEDAQYGKREVLFRPPLCGLSWLCLTLRHDMFGKISHAYAYFFKRLEIILTNRGLDSA